MSPDNPILESEVRPMVLIKDIEPIMVSSGRSVRHREDLTALVESPLLEPCRYLYDLNIQTVSASANKNNLYGYDQGEETVATINLDWTTLSPQNQEIARKYGKVMMARGSYDAQITFPLTPESTEEQVTRAAMESVRQFEKQPLSWGFHDEEGIKQRAGKFGASFDGFVEAYVSRGWYYESVAKRLYGSEELYHKAQQST